jgi:hypothetical protein
MELFRGHRVGYLFDSKRWRLGLLEDDGTYTYIRVLIWEGIVYHLASCTCVLIPRSFGCI